MTTTPESQEAHWKKRNFNPHFIAYLKDPFDEEDVAELYKSSTPSSSLMENAMVWGMKRCAEMLQADGVKGAVKRFQKVLEEDLVSEDELVEEVDYSGPDIEYSDYVEEDEDLEDLL